MTESEWLACTNLNQMQIWIFHTGVHPSSRKNKLFEVACCRQIWHIITDTRCRRAIEVAEQFADGMASENELAAARSALRVRRSRVTTAGQLAESVAGGNTSFSEWGVRKLALRHAGLDPKDEAADAAAMSQQADLYRDIIGNPFRPLNIDPTWLSWRDGTVVKLARAIYDERAFDRLPILADALEDAGCTNNDILDHCRNPGPHVRGCLVVDLLLGKS
jgi:hypothetical protein